MSDSILSAVGAIASIAGSVFGGGSVVLDGFIFSGFAAPEKMTAGGKQSLVVHELPGGDRVIHAMGPQPDPISWTGTFLTPGAQSVAQALDAKRIAGAPVTLSWLGVSYIVVIKTFSYAAKKSQLGDYSISVEVLTSNNPLGDGLTDLLGDVGSDINTAISFAGTVAATASVVLNQAQAVTNGITSITGPNLGSIGTALAGANAALQTAADAATADVTSLATTSILGSSPADLASAVAAAGTLAGAVVAGSYLTRAAVNVTNGLV